MGTDKWDVPTIVIDGAFLVLLVICAEVAVERNYLISALVFSVLAGIYIVLTIRAVQSYKVHRKAGRREGK